MNELLLQLADPLLQRGAGSLAFLHEGVTLLHLLHQIGLLGVRLIQLLLAALVARLQTADDLLQPIHLLLGGDHNGYNEKYRSKRSEQEI